MKGSQYKSMCVALAKGEKRFIGNRAKHQVGKALACFGEEVEIDILGKREIWLKEECDEIAPLNS